MDGALNERRQCGRHSADVIVHQKQDVADFVLGQRLEVGCALLLQLEAPGSQRRVGGHGDRAAQTFGSVTPATGVMVSGAVGSGACGASTKLPGGQATAITVILVTEIVLPRVQAGNFEGEIERQPAVTVQLAGFAPGGGLTRS